LHNLNIRIAVADSNRCCRCRWHVACKHPLSEGTACGIVSDVQFLLSTTGFDANAAAYEALIDMTAAC